MHIFRWILVLGFTLVFMLHDHIFHGLAPYLGDVKESVNTYLKFHSVKNVAFRYIEHPVPEDAKEKSPPPQLVPKIMHHIWLQEDVDGSLDKYEAALDSCVAKHKRDRGWQHWLWTDNITSTWVSSQYPELNITYQSYGQTIQRSNLLRYLVLHNYGGIYLDLDMTCVRPLDDLLHLPFLTSATSTKSVGVNNAFLLSRPRHPFLEYLIYTRAESHARNWPSPWFESMITTGYLFLSNGWMDYVRRHPKPKEEDAVFVLADENGKYKRHALGGQSNTPLFEHAGANSWQTWDTRFFVFAEQNFILLSVLSIMAILIWPFLMAFAIWGVPTRKRHREKKAMRAEAANVHKARAQAMQEHYMAQYQEPESDFNESQSLHSNVFALFRNSPPPTAPPTSYAPVNDRPSSLRSSARAASIYDRPSSTTMMPARAYVSGGHNPRTSSLMPPEEASYRGRPSSYIDYAY